MEEFQEKFLETPSLARGVELCLELNFERRKNAEEILQQMSKNSVSIKDDSSCEISSDEVNYGVDEKTVQEEEDNLIWEPVDSQQEITQEMNQGESQNYSFDNQGMNIRINLIE